MVTSALVGLVVPDEAMRDDDDLHATEGADGLVADSSDWLSSDDSDIDELLQDDDVEMMSLLVNVQAFEDRVKLMDQRRGSKMGRLTIYRNRALGHEHLMQDYFAHGRLRDDLVEHHWHLDGRRIGP
ncbi:ATP-dependent zinc metalloprotease FTSH 5, mitochondrial [Hordeum vulgare]|nr:ATP-dependent zinc metalloprotease FTSH 5, mitochondrial [Hordeum vulgare]